MRISPFSPYLPTPAPTPSRVAGAARPPERGDSENEAIHAKEPAAAAQATERVVEGEVERSTPADVWATQRVARQPPLPTPTARAMAAYNAYFTLAPDGVGRFEGYA